LKSLKTVLGVLAVLGAMAVGTRASANNAGAVVLVNSQSAKFPDFQHFVQPYLGNFGVPYTVLDISSNAVGPALTNYALIIIGHAQLDTNNVFLNAAAQNNLASAVSNGTGLVNFDNVLSGVSNAPLYSFEQTIFGFGYTNAVSGPSVIFPPTDPSNSMHFITSLHQTNQVLQLSNNVAYSTMTVAGLQLASNSTAIATCGGSPFVVTAKYGQGRAVQWASYAWMSSTVQGPVNGLDDLVWRGMVWAARKPFVMRGFPNLVTMRVDDVSGPFWWVHSATNAGFQPFLSLFTQDILSGQSDFVDGRVADLRGLSASGIVTASMHSFSVDTNEFFFFNHATESQWPDATMASNYTLGTQWFQTNGIPISKVIALHYAEIGTNAFNGLTNWGVQFVLINVNPGTVEYVTPGAPWLVGGPYRLYETPQAANSAMPNYYADFLAVPGHPELNGKFFNAYCWIRNVGPQGEWAPADSDISGSISRGVNTLKRGFDSMTLATLLTHEWYLQNPGNNVQNITTAHWQQILFGITSNLAPYNPIYVKLDYGCQYLRATRTSQLTNADIDPVSGQIRAALTGYTDLPISVNVYTGADSLITNSPGSVPAFTGTTNVMVGYASVAAQLLGPVFQGSNAVFTLVGQNGGQYSIQTSADMVHWSQTQTATLSNGPAMITQPLSNASQFYRAKLLP
jgi:hypothetical protein